MTRGVDWETLMQAGHGQLRLSPDSFWSMTPRELSAALGTLSGPVPMDRAALAALMVRHPDARGEHDER